MSLMNLIPLVFLVIPVPLMDHIQVVRAAEIQLNYTLISEEIPGHMGRQFW